VPLGFAACNSRRRCSAAALKPLLYAIAAALPGQRN
jgi:hypothetical protein